jgi:hypothetical protein
MPYKLHFYVSKTKRKLHKLRVFSEALTSVEVVLGIIKFYTRKVLLYFWQEFPVTSTHFEPKLTAINPKTSHIFTAVFLKEKLF